MFGYVKVYRPDLRVREHEAYRGVYCGICRTMGKTFGLRSRFVLGYDSVLLAMLMSDVRSVPLCFRPCRCPVHPLEKRACAENAEPLRFAAAAYLILLWYKLEDDRQDSRSLKTVLARMWVRSACKKARTMYPKLNEIARDYIAEQQKAEALPGQSLDAYADPSSKAMQSFFETLADDEPSRRVLGRIGYMLGRWVYLIDAVDDLEDDLVKKRFNALAASGRKDEAPETLLASLELTRSELVNAYVLLPECEFTPILENVFQQGLKAEARRVLNKSRKKGKNV